MAMATTVAKAVWSGKLRFTVLACRLRTEYTSFTALWRSAQPATEDETAALTNADEVACAMAPHLELGTSPLAAWAGAACLAFLLCPNWAISDETTFAIVEQTVRDRVILKRESYDYAPAVIYD